MATLHPDMNALIEARDRAGPKGETPEEQRAFWFTYSRSLNRPAPGDMAIEDRLVETPDLAVPVRVYRPAGPEGPRPVILYMHGGGFMLGDLDSSDSVAWGYADQTGAVVVSVDYRLTPEHPYPAAFDDCRGVLAAIAADGEAWGIDAGRLAVAGDSAGGNLSAALCLWARDNGGPAIAAQALIYPATGLDQDHPSYVEHADGPGLTTAGTMKYRDYYLPGNRDTDDPYARPVMAQSHAGLPPAWVHSAEIDPIRDDGRIYAAKLAMAGTEVTYREATGMIHGFMRARFTGEAAAYEYALICRFLKERLAA